MVCMMPPHVLISSIKNEGPFLLEWVAHHLVLGFDAIYIASNDCSDGSAALLDALDHDGVITHVPNVVSPGEIPQHSGYARIRRLHPIDRAEWLMVLDADEFLNVHLGGRQVQDLTAHAGAGTDIIRLCARSFSDAPQTCWTPGPVTRLFPMALDARSKTNTAIKTLTRAPHRFARIHNHHMTRYQGDDPLQVYCAGTDSRFTLAPKAEFAEHLRWVKIRQIGHQIAQYNHYSIKTLDSFMLRNLRGRGARPADGQPNTRHTQSYFQDRSARARPEPSILHYAPMSDARMAQLLQSRAVREAQHACETAHAAAIAALPPTFE